MVIVVVIAYTNYIILAMSKYVQKKNCDVVIWIAFETMERSTFKRWKSKKSER